MNTEWSGYDNWLLLYTQKLYNLLLTIHLAVQFRQGDYDG